MLDGLSSGADTGRYGAMKLRPLGPHRVTKILCLKIKEKYLDKSLD